MPSCAVKTCKSSSKTNKKSQGITFHLFPTNSESKTKWITAIRYSRTDPQWLPSKSSVVCSNHFENDDLYTTNRGLYRVTRSGYPKKMLFSSPDVCPIGNLELPSSFSASVPDLPVLPTVAVDDTASSSFSASVPDLPDLPTMVVDDTELSSSSSASVTVLPPSIMYMMGNVEDARFDTPREHTLRQKLISKDKILKNSKKKIKQLQQKVRRLTNRNKSLKNILKSLKNQCDNKELCDDTP